MGFRLLLVLVVAVTAGCSGSTDPKAEYIRKGDAICRDALFTVAKLIPDDFHGPDPDVLRKVVDARGEAVAELRRLEPPAGDAEAKRVMDEIAKSQELYGRGAALTGESEMSVPYVIEGAAQAKKAHELATAYGFRACSRL
jgi:hypothetical protein